ncbi:RICIN domain-containing protein [Streptomyces sp. NPDC060010]|uniref:RICIN domain-containing protein n=1 Tax=Streptomyces sp. NPDC060010 TaxID=3347036 RepID=UPI0036A3575F
MNLSLKRRRFFSFLAGAAVVASSLVSIQPAQADPVQSAARAGEFSLTRVGSDNSGLISSLESARIVRKADYTEVLGDKTGRPGLCHGHGLNGTLSYDGFCWDNEDDLTKPSLPGGGWTPQGFAGSHAAYPDGTYKGRRSLYAATWYHATSYEEPGKDLYGRISLVEATNSQVRYGHLALVEPVEGGFKKLQHKIHADGVAWYRNWLLVANGTELQVYDLRHVWRMTSTGSGTGVVSGQSSAFGHTWALPLVARYATTGATIGNPRACGLATAGQPLCLSTVSVDRSEADVPSLLSAENKEGGDARVVRWPLTSFGEDSLPDQVASSSDFRTAVWAVQGIARDGKYYYFSGSCPRTWPGWTEQKDKDGSVVWVNTMYSCIHVYNTATQVTQVLSQAPFLTQGLSFDPQARRLWGMNEAYNGARVVFSLAPYAGNMQDGGWGWLSNHNRPGFVCATPQGNATANGTPVTVWPCNGSEMQRWAHKDGLLVHKESGKCLTPQGNAAGANGTLLTLWTCNADSDVQRFAGSAGGFVNNWGKAITPKGNSFESGVWLTLWTRDVPPPDPVGEQIGEGDVQEWTVRGFLDAP